MRRLLYVLMVAVPMLFASCICEQDKYKATWDIRVTYLDGKTESKTIVLDGAVESSTLVLVSNESHPTPCIVVSHPGSLLSDQDLICGVREFSVVSERKDKVETSDAGSDQQTKTKRSRSPLL